MSALRSTTRLARREVRRRPGRTALVVALIAIPVAATIVTLVVFRTSDLSPLERHRLTWGHPDLVVPGTADSVGELPAGSRAVEVRSQWNYVGRAEGGVTQAWVTNFPLGDPMTRGTFVFDAGHATTAANEIVLTRELADTWYASVGSEIQIELGGPHIVRVAGIGRERQRLTGRTLFIDPGAAWALPQEGTPYTLIDLPAGIDLANVVNTLNQRNVFVTSANAEASFVSPDLRDQVRWSLVISAITFLVLGIVIASAFAAGTRRQLVTLGHLSANGATALVLRRALALQGTITGVIGVAAGLVLGGVALVTLSPHIDGIRGFDLPSWEINGRDILAVALLGILTATIAALVPARAATRISVIEALAGRRPLGRVPAWITRGGVIAVGAGFALFAIAIIGDRSSHADAWKYLAIVASACSLLGMCATTPRLVSLLEPMAGQLRGPWRLAARSLARQRTRTAAVVAAVTATGALGVGGAAIVASYDASPRDGGSDLRADLVALDAYQAPILPAAAANGVYNTYEPLRTTPVPSAVIDDVTNVIPGSTFITLTGLEAGYRYIDLTGQLNSIALATPEVLALQGLEADARAALDDVGAIVLDRGRGEHQIVISRPELDQPPYEFAAAGFASNGALASAQLANVLVTQEKADDIGLPLNATTIIVDAPRDLTRSEADQLVDRVNAYNNRAYSDSVPSTTVNIIVKHNDRRIDPNLLEGILSALALLAVMFVVAASLALAAADSRDERATLAVVGTGPSVLRRMNARKAILLAGIGGAAAIPLGFIPAAIFTQLTGSDLATVFPWRTALLVALVIPVTAGLGASAASAISLRVRPVHLSNLTYD